jgi:hypothetical protein
MIIASQIELELCNLLLHKISTIYSIKVTREIKLIVDGFEKAE